MGNPIAKRKRIDNKIYVRIETKLYIHSRILSVALANAYKNPFLCAYLPHSESSRCVQMGPQRWRVLCVRFCGGTQRKPMATDGGRGLGGADGCGSIKKATKLIRTVRVWHGNMCNDTQRNRHYIIDGGRDNGNAFRIYKVFIRERLCTNNSLDEGSEYV